MSRGIVKPTNWHLGCSPDNTPQPLKYASAAAGLLEQRIILFEQVCRSHRRGSRSQSAPRHALGAHQLVGETLVHPKRRVAFGLVEVTASVVVGPSEANPAPQQHEVGTDICTQSSASDETWGRGCRSGP